MDKDLVKVRFHLVEMLFSDGKTKEMLTLLVKLSQKMKNDVWAARRPNRYQVLL